MKALHNLSPLVPNPRTSLGPPSSSPTLGPTLAPPPHAPP